MEEQDRKSYQRERKSFAHVSGHQSNSEASCNGVVLYSSIKVVCLIA